MAITEQWNIKSRSHHCHQTEEPFAEGDTFVAALFEAEDGSLERRDYSLAAWEGLPDDAPAPFSSWRSTYVPPVREEKVEAVKKETAEGLLRRLIEEDAEHTENARFVLAVMLERQKLLRETDRQTIGETRLLVYEHRKTGDVFLVRDPLIPLTEVDRIQEEVVVLLGGGEEEDATGASGPDEGDGGETPPAGQVGTADGSAEEGGPDPSHGDRK